MKFIEKYDIVDKLVRIGTDSAAVMRKAFMDLIVIPEVEDSQEDILPLDNASDLIDELLDDIEPTDHSLVVIDVRVIFLRLTQQMDRSNPLFLLRCSETLSVKFHFRCSCHWLQRVVIDILNGVNTHLKRIISKARVLTAKVRKSTIDFPMLMGNNCFIPATNDTRWSSIYKMISGILEAENKGVLNQLNSVESRNCLTCSELRCLKNSHFLKMSLLQEELTQFH